MPFNTLTNVWHHRAKLPIDENVFHSSKTSLRKSHKKNVVFTCVEEQMMFFNEKVAFNCPLGLNNQFVYFYTCNFFIKMGKEM
jgi:hypothetical protein